jgi:3alpha(or 20beta)-hydroxysteroid dehydrogenase
MAARVQEGSGMARLDGKVALITGAARGMGAAEARLFAAEGAKVVLTDLLDAEGQAVAAEIGAAARWLHHDVTREADWAAAVALAQRDFGGLDLLVNNAGIYQPSPLPDCETELFERIWRVNQLGVFLGMRAAVPAMRARGGGAIVNISSIAGLRGFPGAVAYVGTNWAVRGMTKTAAVELAPDRIRINSVHPGLIETPMIAANPPEVNAGIVAATPLKRAGSAEGVARLVLFLASDEASYVTGAEVAVDGGWTA